MGELINTLLYLPQGLVYPKILSRLGTFRKSRGGRQSPCTEYLWSISERWDGEGRFFLRQLFVVNEFENLDATYYHAERGNFVLKTRTFFKCVLQK